MRWLVRDLEIPKLFCWIFFPLVFLLVIALKPARLSAQPVPNLEQQLKSVESSRLADEAVLRGNPGRGALVFYTSVAGCIKCHLPSQATAPLGPDLSKLATIHKEPIDETYLIDSLLYPSKSICSGYNVVLVLTDENVIIKGMYVGETEDELVLRDLNSLENELRVSKLSIEDRKTVPQSMMPDGLIATLRSIGEFYDLASYVFEVVRGGDKRAKELQPTPEQLVVKDDVSNLDHAGIIREVQKNRRSLESGRATFDGLCASCHGLDGNTPSLASARAFGTQKLKFGSDPHSMFLTLSRGNGLMAATTYLSPKERYEVVHYIRERFMKDTNPDYQIVTEDYLSSLPAGTEDGEFKPDGARDYGPALASQLGDKISSVLTIKLGGLTASYNLHTMDLAGLWENGFLNLNQTQHQRGRGEGYPEPEGKLLPNLGGWRWAHEGTFDYPTNELLPRGPLPSKWLEYQGHYIHDESIVLKYKIDGRQVFELPGQYQNQRSVIRNFRIGPGNALKLATAAGDAEHSGVEGVVNDDLIHNLKAGKAENAIAFTGIKFDSSNDWFVASRAYGDNDGLTWEIDSSHRLILNIPADKKERLFSVCSSIVENVSSLPSNDAIAPYEIDPAGLINGGTENWPGTLHTVGYRGLEKGSYAVDTISIPDQTPWNSWLRTTALDFFEDGRMVVTTHGGDVWIVSGVDDQLLDIRWKRFAGGLYEPFGVKVVDGLIYVTCKDRITRLHDYNDDGEADFYESFFADPDVSTFFHAFNFDLHTDSQGNFYYAKCGQYTSYALPGSVVKVSPDGKKHSIFCTGFRTPNGMGMLPDNRMTVSDNQGNWMPASKISLVRPGGFYGYVQNKRGGKQWSPDGGRIDPSKVLAPPTFDQPLIWMPQDVDNSSGGQLWVSDARWGPLSGSLLHTSFGKGWMYRLMIQDFEQGSQAALIKLHHNFSTGVMRARVNPVDGQVYATGLNGWNENGRAGLGENGIQRIRYTGIDENRVTDCKVLSNALRIDFNFQLDLSTANDLASFEIDQWNYHWTENYGSEFYKPTNGEVGIEAVKIDSIEIGAERKSVFLKIDSLRPVNQLRLRMKLHDKAGNRFDEEIYWTINHLPK